MKNYIPILTLLILSIFSCQRMEDTYVKDLHAERAIKDSLFTIEAESPLSKEQIVDFKGLKYYPINKDYLLTARIEPLSVEQIVKLKTSTDRLPDYRLYAYVYFELKGKPYKLSAYQSIDPGDDSLSKTLLFLPFTDDNSTVTTYGGGRYIDFTIPEDSEFVLDFNKAYNPYCAYSHRWSCVIPPRENSLDIAIDAGEKMYPQTNH